MFTPQLFARRYLLLDRIATGGMAEVFKAKSHGVEGFEKLVVIKRILPHLSRNTRFVSMFINEAKIAVSLNHGNIVQVYNLGKHGEDYYIAMEYVHGRDLMQVLRACRQSNRRLPVPLVLFIVSEVAKGLDYAHRKQDAAGRNLQIVHRDISPHNVVVSFEGEVKIVDFGIAKIVSQVMDDNSRQQNRLGGKFAYMSPEQANGGGMDPRSDLFSLGLVLYELITGHKAYQARVLAEKLEQVRQARFKPPRELLPDLPQELERILLKMLAVSPDDRYQYGSDVYEDLTELMFSSCGVITAATLGGFMRELFADEIVREQDTSGLKAVVGSLERLERDPDASEVTVPPKGGEVVPEHDPDDTTGGEGTSLSIVPGVLPVVEARGNLKRTLIVLMAEPIGLVDLATQLSDDQYLDLLNALVETVQPVIQEHGGHLDSFVYDRFCALWGLQRSQEDDAERAVLCAIALRKAVDKFRQKRRVSLSLSMAIHLGTALVGQRDGRIRHTALGDTFKLPIRLLNECEPGQTWISERLRERVEVAFKLSTGRPVRTFWGRRETNGFQVLSVHTPFERARLEALRNLKRDRWFSRGDELEQLAAALNEVNNRRGTVLALTGETGIGKSRLVAEIGRLVHRKNVGWMVGNCQFKDQNVPLAVFRDLLASGCRILPTDSPEQVRDKLNGLLELGLKPPDLRFFATLFHSSDAGPSPIGLEGTDVLESMFLAARRLIYGMSTERPMIFVFENVQWMDLATWRLLQSLMDISHELPVLVLLTYRPSFTPPIQHRPGFREIHLGPLNAEKTGELAQAILGIDTVPPDVAEELHKRTDGNPLYLEQLLKYLLEGRHIVVEGNQLRRVSLHAAAMVPPTLSGLIESRVDSLSISGRELLQGMAVCGRLVPLDVMRRIWGSQIAIEPVVQELASRDLVSVQDGQAAFRNNLTWEVAYHSMATRDRRALHIRVGEGLEQTFATDLSRHAEELYLHFEEGGAYLKAARYSSMAGDRYAGEDFLVNAINFYTKALELYKECSEPGLDEEALLTEMAGVYLKAGRLQLVTGDRTNAEKTLDSGLDIAGELENDILEIRFLLELGPLRAEKGDLVVARSYLEHAQELSEELSNLELSCAVMDALGSFYLDVGEQAAAIKTFERGLRLAESEDVPLAVARLLRGRGTWRLHRGEYVGALADLNRALALVEQAGDTLLSGRILTNIGNIYNLMGRPDEAMDFYRRAGDIYQALGFIRGAIINAHNIGDLFFRTHRLGRAYVSFQESRKMAREYNWVRGEAFNMVYLGYIEAETGTPESGLRTLQEGIESCRKLGEREFEAVGLWLGGRHLLRRQPDKAFSWLSQALELARKVGEPRLEREVLQALGEL